MQLAILAPGVSGLDYAQPSTINTGKRPDALRPVTRWCRQTVLLSQSNQVLFDGIDNTEMISQTFIVRPAVEGIHEFKVLTNDAGAEFGRSVDAVVVVTNKSGTNHFRDPCSNSCATKSWMRGTSSRGQTSPSRHSSSTGTEPVWVGQYVATTRCSS